MITEHAPTLEVTNIHVHELRAPLRGNEAVVDVKWLGFVPPEVVGRPRLLAVRFLEEGMVRVDGAEVFNPSEAVPRFAPLGK